MHDGCLKIGLIIRTPWILILVVLVVLMVMMCAVCSCGRVGVGCSCHYDFDGFVGVVLMSVKVLATLFVIMLVILWVMMLVNT